MFLSIEDTANDVRIIYVFSLSVNKCAFSSYRLLSFPFAKIARSVAYRDLHVDVIRTIENKP